MTDSADEVSCIPQLASGDSPARRARILLVIPTLDQSGAEKQFTMLATGLPRDEFEVEVVALTRGGHYASELSRAGIPVTVLGKRLKLDPVTLLRLRRLIRTRRPDVVHSWLFAANAYVRLVTGAGGPPVIVSERCVDIWKAGWQTWLDRRLVGRTCRLLGNSQAVLDFYQELGYPVDRMRVISNAVLPVRSQIDRRALCAEFDIPEDARIVGTIGRLAPQKRVQDLVWAAQLLQQIHQQVYFLFVGEGPDRDVIEEFLQQFDVRTRVRLPGHRVDAVELMPLLDVFWLASEYEGQSNSIMEAMAAGVPVVCSDIPANRELVRDGQTGFVVDVGDSVGFAQFADRILADPELARRLGANARQVIEQQYAPADMMARHCDLYRQVLADRESLGASVSG